MSKPKISLEGKTAAHITLGCKVNMYDTQAMAEILKDHGVHVIDFSERADKPADIYIINTCTVTNSGDKKSRQAIRKASKLNPKAIIVVCGCYSQIAPEGVSLIEGVDIILGTKDRSKIAELIMQHMEGVTQKNFVSDLSDESEFEDLNIQETGGNARAYIKIQEGCENFCTYCIIPYARGPIRSRAKDSILAEAKRLAAAGVKEIVLAGINVGNYGKDKDSLGISLSDIIRGLSELADIERIRLGSIEPDAVNDEFLDTLSDCHKLCDHLHISLQSGSDNTLRAMGRRYNTDDYKTIVEKLRQIRPNIGITTDIIVGFPKESDEDFIESYNFAEQMAFSKVHVFPYSAKVGTKAALMDGQVPAAVKTYRAKKMNTLADTLCEKFAKKFEHTKLSVLFEQEIGNNVFEGHSSNYIVVRHKSDIDLTNRILEVRCEYESNGYLRTL